MFREGRRKIGRGAGALVFAVIFTASSARAVDSAFPRDLVNESKSDSIESDVEWRDFLIERNKSVAVWFDGVADGLDLFLAGKRLTKRKNETSVRLENTTYIDDGQPIRNSAGVGVNLKLPNLEEYWKVKFTSYDEREEKRGVRQSYLRQQPRQTNYGATVGLFRKLGDVRTSFEPRIELQDPLKISHSLTFESVAEVRKLEVNPKVELFASPDKGTGIFVALNVNHYLSRTQTLTYLNEGEYQDRPHSFSVTNGVSLGQVWNKTTSLSYDFLLGSGNHPNYHLESITFAFTYSELIYEKIVDYHITPHLDFTKATSFSPKTGLVFTLGVTF